MTTPSHKIVKKIWFLRLGVAVAFLLTGYFGQSLSLPRSIVTPLWPPSGVALGSLMIWGARMWPAIWIASLLTNIFGLIRSASPNVGSKIVTTSFLLATGGTIQAFVGLYFAFRFFENRNPLDKTSDVLKFILFCGMISCMINATSGTSVYTLMGYSPISEYFSTWFRFWLGDLMGVLIFAPLILAWAYRKRFWKKWQAWQCLEVGVILLLILLVRRAFSHSELIASFSIAYLILPIVVWATLRFQQLGATVAILMTSLLAIETTLHDLGPFRGETPTDSVFLLSFFMSNISITVLVLTSVLSERKASEVLLAQSNKELKNTNEERLNLLMHTQRLLKIRDEFILRASHELKTPVTSIYLQVQIMKTLAARDVSMVLPKGFDILSRQVQNLVNLIDKLFYTVDLESKKIEISLKRVNLSELVQETIDRLVPVIRREGCTIRSQIERDIVGNWDQTRIEEVVVNLISNAIKFGKGKPIDITLKKDQNVALLTVRDYGIGIKKEDQYRIFEKYERAVSIHKYSGFGLGLYLSQQIIEAHGGKIYVQSGSGVGAMFVVELPIR